jgi:surface polysaccharide O-acyltransferase-like enzyme
MIQLLIFMIAAYGMTTILVYGSIFNGLRDSIHNWGNNEYAPFNYLGKFISQLIQCMLCTSVWVGFFLSLVMFSPVTTFIGLNEYFSVFFDGMFSAGSVWAINAIIEWFEENRPVKEQVYFEEPQQEEEQILND